jgi:hypothetical protein
MGAYHLLLRFLLILLGLPAPDGAADSDSSCLDNLPCLALRVHDSDVVLQLGVGIFTSSLTANKVHLLVFRRLQQHLSRDNARIPCSCPLDIMASFGVWVEAEAL